MIKFFQNIKDKIWDFFFLDFYFDKHYTFRFKVMNFISRDYLRSSLSRLNYSIYRAKDLKDTFCASEEDSSAFKRTAIGYRIDYLYDTINEMHSEWETGK